MYVINDISNNGINDTRINDSYVLRINDKEWMTWQAWIMLNVWTNIMKWMFEC